MEAQSLAGLVGLPLVVMALGMAWQGGGLILVVEALLLLKEVNIITCGVEKKVPVKGSVTISQYQTILYEYLFKMLYTTRTNT